MLRLLREIVLTEWDKIHSPMSLSRLLLKTLKNREKNLRAKAMMEKQRV